MNGVYFIVMSVWLLVYRAALGGTLMLHGYPKLKDRAKQAGQWMQSMGIPAWTAALAMILEFFGGALLILGFLTRLVSAFVAIFMVANIIMKKTKMKAAYVSMDKPSYEIDVLYLLLSVTLAVVGPGALSADRLIGLA